MSYPRDDVLHGPSDFQGNRLEYLYNVQNINHIQDILDYGQRWSILGNFATLAIEDSKLEVGIEGPLFIPTIYPISQYH